MSKWISKELFDTFQKEKIEEKDTSSSGFKRSDMIWQTPQKGTVEVAKVYEGRFLTDPKGEFYKKYYYHFWQSGENWIFVLCPKTHDFKNYCPFCSAVNKLFNGTKQDKSQAYLLKRKERFVGNFYIDKDPRDEQRDDEYKVVGKVKLYEFPSQVEKKLKKEITDKNQGYGLQIFDPSEIGRNLILNVLSTKKDDKGKQYPDYSSSEFSRIQSALGTDEEIDALMATCVDIVEYIKSMDVDKDKMVEILKNEFLWTLVESECIKNGFKDPEEGGNIPSDDIPEREEPQDEEQTDDTTNQEELQDEESVQEESTASDDDIDDDDLLAELDKL